MFNVIVRKDHNGMNVVFDADSVKNGQITALVNNEERVVGVDYYALTTELEPKEVVKTIEQWRAAYNIPETDIAVRKRLRKGYALKSSPVQPRNRRLDDQKPAQIIHAAHIEQPLRRAEDKPQEIVQEDVAEKDAVVSVIEAIHNNESETVVAEKMKAATLSLSRKDRKAKRVEAAKRRYEAEVAVTNANMQSAVAHAGNVQQSAQEPTMTITQSQLSEMIAAAVAGAIAKFVPVAA